MFQIIVLYWGIFTPKVPEIGTIVTKKFQISTGKPDFVIDKEKIYDKTNTAGFESVDDPTTKTTKNIDSSDRKVLKEKNVEERGNQLNADSAQGLQNKLQVKS